MAKRKRSGKSSAEKHVASRVIFRDKRGKYVAESDRYKRGLVQTVQVKRRGRYVDVIEDGGLTPERVADVLTRQEFEGLSTSFRELKTYTSRAKYKAWDIAKQIDKTPSIRRKLIKVEMLLSDGQRTRKANFYVKLNRNQQASYTLFQRMNEAVGFDNMYLYNKIGQRVIEGRAGRKVSLVSVTVNEVLV